MFAWNLCKCRMKAALILLHIALFLSLGSEVVLAASINKAIQHYNSAHEIKNSDKFTPNEERSLSFLILVIIIPALKKFFSERFSGYH